MDFYPNPGITSSASFLFDWPLNMVYLKNIASYPWLILVPKVAQVTEIIDLNYDMQQQLMREINQASVLLKNTFQPTKLNIASLGNIIPQLHIHVVARFEGDPLWPHGIWQEALISSPYPKEILEERILLLRKNIAHLEP